MEPAMHTLGPRFDVIIIGARCAGAATAMLLARRGLRVLLAERGAPGDDTLSTHALMRAGVLQLHRWGVLPAVIAAGTPAIGAATFHYAADTVAFPIKPRDGIDALYAPRRNVLDPHLVAAARDAGAIVQHHTRALEIVRAGDRVTGVVLADATGATTTVSAPIVVGADGLRSLVARSVGARVERRAQHASAILYAHWSGVREAGYHWYWQREASAGLIPTNGGACVFVAVSAERYHDEVRHDLEAGYVRVLDEAAPGLARALATSPRSSLRPFAGVPGFLRTATGPGWALVGDAGYFKDPLTAHGMTDALRDAELLADAIAAGTEHALARYQEERDALSSDLFGLTDRIASFAWDLEEVRELHRQLSASMLPEYERLHGPRVQATRAAIG